MNMLEDKMDELEERLYNQLRVLQLDGFLSAQLEKKIELTLRRQIAYQLGTAILDEWKIDYVMF